MIEDRKGNWMQTATGRVFWPLDPRPEEVYIEDISSALSKLCRFGGHSKRFYSVAEHCCHVARAAPEYLKLAALMHDASEAYLCDVPRPIKASLTNYAAIEGRLNAVISQRFGFQYPEPREVKDLDNGILIDELEQAMRPAPMLWDIDGVSIGAKLEFWTPEMARAEFNLAFVRYSGRD